MSGKIVFIDGHSILNRAFYGLPDLTASGGRHTGAVYGFLNILFKILEEEQPDYLTIAFDTHAPTFRHKMYEAYKGTRHPMPEELREQVPLMQEVLKAMGVPIVMKEGFEADDILGTLSVKAEKEGLDVSVVSGDRDLLQLATEKVLIRIPRTKGGKTEITDYHAGDVEEAYGLTPPQIVELKALMGDTADNIPGVPGIGIKTATKILKEYGTVENAYAHVEDIRPQKAMTALRDHYDSALLSEKLAKINTDSPVELDLEKARLGNLFTPEACEMFRDLGFKKLLTRFEAAPAAEKKMVEVRTVTELEEADTLLKKAAGADRTGLFLLRQTDRKSGKCHVCGLGLSLPDQKDGTGGTFYIPAGGFVTENLLLDAVRRIAGECSLLCTFGFKEMVRAADLPESAEGSVFDIKIAAYLLNPLTSDYSFDTIAKDCGAEGVLSAEEIFQSKKIPMPEQMETDKAAVYAGETAFAALAAQPVLERRLEENGMLALFRDMEMPLVYVLADMERAGIRVLPEELEQYGNRLTEGIRQVEASVYEQAGETFNINSPKQLGEILFEKMKLPGGKKTKTGYSTAADVLEKLAPETPIVRDILEYRQLTKLKSTYADGLAAFIADDGRIHSVFHQTITATGRISSTDPNLQNIPVRMELGRQIRKVFLPAEGFVFLDADYSQIELRVLAHLSGDQKLIDAYRMEKDIHAITASQVFHVPFDQVTPLQRRNAKAVNFGIVYGISSFGLAEDLGISRKEAAEYIEQYYQTYPGIRSFLEGLVTSAREKGYSETMYGRRRPMPELKSSNFMQRQFGERVAKNAPIQGTAADIIKIAMIRVSRRLKEEKLKSRLILQVHDELLLETAKDELEKVSRILEEEMTGAAKLAVRLEIDMHTGNSWYEAK